MKKFIVVADGMLKPEELDAPQYHTLFDQLLPYDVETKVVYDDSLVKSLQPGETFSKAMLRVEKEGPEWVEQSESFLKEIEDASFVMVNFSAVGTKMLDRAKKLELLSVCRSGTENANISAASERNIIVCNAPGRVAGPVADFAVTMMLALNRKLEILNMTHNGRTWPTTEELLNGGCMLMKDAVVGLVGYGRIGHMVIERLKGFGCTKFLAYDPYANKEHAAADGVELVSLEQVMSESDFVTIHARLTPETENLVGRKELALMKPTAFLINTARAGLLDEQALIDALQNKQIRGAGLDVYRTEPLNEDSPLLQMENVILTPHAAGAAGDPMLASCEIVVQELLRYCKGEPLRNRIK